MKLIDIKSFVSNHELPKTLQLNSNTFISDLDKFFLSHISTLESECSKAIKLLNYERIIKAIHLLRDNGVKLKVQPKESATISTNIEQKILNNVFDEPQKNESPAPIDNNNQDDSFDVFKNIENGSGVLRPNTSFDSSITQNPAPKPVTPQVVETTALEPQAFQVVEPKITEKSNPQPTQASLF